MVKDDTTKFDKSILEEKMVKRNTYFQEAVLVFLLVFTLFSYFGLVIATPQGPTSVLNTANSTKGNTAAFVVNTSGGQISTLLINATTQNTRWKAFVGNVTGKLTLDDASGATIYDWTLTSAATSGEIYATRNVTTPTWANIRCANVTLMERENILINQTSPVDNLSATFNSTGTHAAFTVGNVSISSNTCPTLNTYVNNASQDTRFEEMALTDITNFSVLNGMIIYTSILEQDRTGYDNLAHDFQVLVPENGAATWTGTTAYYIYVELT